jgi:hypothetical protein
MTDVGCMDNKINSCGARQRQLHAAPRLPTVPPLPDGAFALKVADPPAPNLPRPMLKLGKSSWLNAAST